MLAKGTGARGIVHSKRAVPLGDKRIMKSGHVANVTNRGGIITHADGQTGGKTDFSPRQKFVDFELIITNPGNPGYGAAVDAASDGVGTATGGAVAGSSGQ